MGDENSGQASPKKETIQQAFNKAAEDCRQSFPEQLKTLLVISTTEQIYVSPHIANHLTRNVAAVKKLIEDNALYMRVKSTIGLASHIAIDSVIIDCISIDTQQTKKICVSKKYPQDMNLTHVFDHEIGHLVVKEGWPKNSSPHVAECAADAYATLRHLQHFGDATDIFENLPYNRASLVAARSDAIHYTSGAIQRVANLQKEGLLNLYALSLQQTAKLAGEIALRYALDKQTLNKIFIAYAPARECYEGPQSEAEKDWARIIRSVVRVMHENKADHDIYRAGRLYLLCPDIKEHIDAVIENDPSFSALFNFIPQHEKDSGFILNAADAMDVNRLPAKHQTATIPNAPR